MIDRLECCFSAVYPLPRVQESKSWQSLSDFWTRTNEHIDDRALCSSSHLLQAVVYMLMPDSVTPARPNHFLSCCSSCAAGFIIIWTPIRFDRNVTCDDVLSGASARSRYLLNLVSWQRSADYKIYFAVTSGQPRAQNKISFRFAVLVYPGVTGLSAVKISNLFSIGPQQERLLICSELPCLCDHSVCQCIRGNVCVHYLMHFHVCFAPLTKLPERFRCYK